MSLAPYKCYELWQLSLLGTVKNQLWIVDKKIMKDRILIVDALSAGSGQRSSSRDSIGCGPRTVAGLFEKHQLDCRIHRVEDILSKRSLLRRFDHMAVSAMTMDLSATKKVVRLWRQANQKGRVIIGGPISAEPERTLTEIKPDIVVIGEGEATLDDILRTDALNNCNSLSEIPGIAFIKSGKIHMTKFRSLLSAAEFSEKYFPSTVRIIDYPVYQASKVYVEILRGCSNFKRTKLPLPDGSKCTDCENCDSEVAKVRMNCPESIPPGCGFCSVPGTWGPPRSRSVDSIVKEVQELVDLDVHRVVLEAPGFLDYKRGTEPLTDPCHPPANLVAIRDLLGKLNSLPQVREGSIHIAIENMKACLFTEDVAKTLIESMISSSPNIGLETGSDYHMQQIGKCGNSGDVIQAVKIAQKYGMKPFVYLIYGLPGENAETTEQSIRMMRDVSESGAERIILYGFRALPGSAFADFPESSKKDEHGLRLRKEAEKINRRKKEQYVGTIVRGIAAEPSKTHHGFTMVYPFEEGPLMTVQGGFSSGTLLSVRIKDVLSSGLVAGEVVQESDTRVS
ncbi:MAG: B12-binding domain-containing radical SAM protein [Candidatus Thorarchaeota archaeon]